MEEELNEITKMVGGVVDSYEAVPGKSRSRVIEVEISKEVSRYKKKGSYLKVYPERRRVEDLDSALPQHVMTEIRGKTGYEVSTKPQKSS